MLGFKLAARSKFSIRLACGFQDRCQSCHRFVTAQDNLDVEWVQLDAATGSASLFAGDESRSRTEEWVDDDVAAFGHIEQRIFQHGNWLGGRVVLQSIARFGVQAGARMGPN